MAEQLAYLRTAMALPAVSLGVIPFTASRTMWPVETFNVFDDREAGVELLSAQVTVTAPGEVGLYVQAFDRFKDRAVYGAEARALISKAIGFLG
ncbi:hypothetical protein GCM10009759_73580 [Kitasatospora saccharophila]|uniref:DUF5753 domain-containing protein n=1 Tax=Kitasatospora saccharophila TaxID=407973 RepID=A0ABN2Y8H1_9ACTN